MDGQWLNSTLILKATPAKFEPIETRIPFIYCIVRSICILLTINMIFSRLTTENILIETDYDINLKTLDTPKKNEEFKRIYGHLEGKGKGGANVAAIIGM